MDEASYRALVAVVEYKTVSGAARHLHLTQPTLTRQIQGLEKELGMPLFDRHGRRLQLTKTGERVYRHAQRVLQMEQRLKDDISGLLDPSIGNIYMAAGLTPSIYFLPPLIAEYRALYPGVRLQVQTGSSVAVCDVLRQREADLGVVTTVPQGTDEFMAHPLYQDKLRLVVRPDHPLAGQGQILLEQLQHIPLVLMNRSSGLRTMVDNLVRDHDLPLQTVMETDNLESINRLVQSGVGASFLPESAVAEDIRAGRLTPLVVVDADLGARTITLLHRRTALSAAAQQFVTYLVAQARHHTK